MSHDSGNLYHQIHHNKLSSTIIRKLDDHFLSLLSSVSQSNWTTHFQLFLKQSNFSTCIKMNKHVKATTSIVILSVVVSSFNVAGQFSKAKLHPNCLRVEPTRQLSSEWGLRLFAGAHFYIPFGSSQAIQHISKLIYAGSKDVSKYDGEDDIKKLCALVRIKGFKLKMEGHEGNYLIQDCAVIKKGANDCTVNRLSENPEFQKNGDAVANIVWTDNETSMAIVRCSADGLYNDWYVFSTLTSLNSTMKNAIISSVVKLGFPNKPEDTLSPSYEGCELFSAEELKDD